MHDVSWSSLPPDTERHLQRHVFLAPFLPS
jgi:hypothetical protein